MGEVYMRNFKANSLKFMLEFLMNFAIVMIASLCFMYIVKIKINKPIVNLIVIAVAVSLSMTWGMFAIEWHHNKHN